MGAGAVLAVGVLVLSGCSAAASGSAATSATPAPEGAAGGAAAGPGAFGGGVSGEIAAVSGTTLQVQDDSSQTAVTYTATTAITQTVEASLGDVAVGSCVTISSADDVATTVVVSAAVDGSCAGIGVGGAGGFGGVGGAGGAGGGFSPGAGELPEGMPTDAPTAPGAGEDAPTAPTAPTGPTGPTAPTGEDAPTGSAPDGGGPGAAGGGPGGGAFTSGLVTAVSGTTITVRSELPASPSREDADADVPGAATETTTEVAVADSTTYSATVAADAAALAVGACVTARGESDDSGALAATTLAISAAVDGTCTTVFAVTPATLPAA